MDYWLSCRRFDAAPPPQAPKDDYVFSWRHARNRPVRWLNLKPNQERSDGCVLAHTEGDLRQLTSSFAHACGEFAIKISLKKTKILCQDVSSTLSGGGGLHLSRLRHFQQPLPRHWTAWINGKAAAARLASLGKRVWDNTMLTISTKMKVYQACVLSTLLYGSEV